MENTKTRTKKRTARELKKAGFVGRDEVSIGDDVELSKVAMKTARKMNQRDKLEAELAERRAELEAELLKLNDRAKPRLDKINAEIAANVDGMRTYAEAHRGRLCGKSQGVEIAGHRLDWRKGTGKVALADGVKEGEVVDSILDLDENVFGEFIDDAVRAKLSLNKDELARLWRLNEGLVDCDKLRALGVRVVVEEAFKFTPGIGDDSEVSKEG